MNTVFRSCIVFVNSGKISRTPIETQRKLLWLNKAIVNIRVRPGSDVAVEGQCEYTSRCHIRAVLFWVSLNIRLYRVAYSWPLRTDTTSSMNRKFTQSCPWVGFTHGLGWVGSRFFSFWWVGLVPLQKKY